MAWNEIDYVTEKWAARNMQKAWKKNQRALQIGDVVYESRRKAGLAEGVSYGTINRWLNQKRTDDGRMVKKL